MTTTTQNVQEKIDASINRLTNKLKKMLKEDGGIPQMIVLYDDKGESHLLSHEQQEFIFRVMPKDQFVPFLKFAIEELKKRGGINIISSAVFQCVYYKKAGDKDDPELEALKKGEKRVSEVKGHDEALFIVREDKQSVSTMMYGTVYNDEGDVVISDYPVEENTVEKNNEKGDKIESWFIGFLD